MNVQNPCSDASGENDSRHELVTCPRCNQTVSCKPTSISACWCIQEKVSRETLQNGLDLEVSHVVHAQLNEKYKF